MLLKKAFETNDLSRFDGMRPTDILKALRTEGYVEIGGGFNQTVLQKPGDREVIKLTNFVHQAQAFVDLCAANPHNPYFPEIYDARLIQGDPPAFIYTCEALLTRAQVPPDLATVLGGGGRALATLVHGHESHKDAHRHMLRNTVLAQAVTSMIGIMLDHLDRRDDTFVYYSSDYSEDTCGPIDDWFSDDILFRPPVNKAGGWQMVFADPFHEGVIKDSAEREALRDEFMELKMRVERLSQNPGASNKTGPVTQPGLNV